MSVPHPLLTSSRSGSYAHCECGWRSGPFTSVTGAHISYGQHLLIAHPASA